MTPLKQEKKKEKREVFMLLSDGLKWECSSNRSTTQRGSYAIRYVVVPVWRSHCLAFTSFRSLSFPDSLMLGLLFHGGCVCLLVFKPSQMVCVCVRVYPFYVPIKSHGDIKFQLLLCDLWASFRFLFLNLLSCKYIESPKTISNPRNFNHRLKRPFPLYKHALWIIWLKMVRSKACSTYIVITLNKMLSSY